MATLPLFGNTNIQQNEPITQTTTGFPPVDPVLSAAAPTPPPVVINTDQPVYSLTDMVGPPSAVQNALTIVGSVDGNGNVFIGDQDNLVVDQSGNFANPITMNNIIENSLSLKINSISTTTATTNINLRQGQYIALSQNMATDIVFQNFPYGPGGSYVTEVRIRRLNNSVGSNYYPLTFTVGDGFGGARTVFEGGHLYYPSMPGGNIDLLDMWLLGDSSGTSYHLFIRNPQANMTQAGGAPTTVTAPAQIVMTNAATKPKSALVTNSLVSMNAAGEFLGTDVISNTTGFNGSVALTNCTASLIAGNCNLITLPTDGPLTLDVGNFNYTTLLQDANATSVTLTGVIPGQRSKHTLFRFKDSTANPYTINWNAGWDWDINPVLTQTPNAIDILVITINEDGTQFLNIFQNFKQGS